MELEKLIGGFKEEVPEKVIAINESIDLLKETISDAIKKLGLKVSKSFENRDFDKMRYYVELAENAEKYEAKLEEIIEFLDVSVVEEKIKIEEHVDDTLNYEVDINEEHSLYEDFTHKRPFGFKINNYNIIKTKSWKEMLVKTCECLIAVDEEKFISFENDENMNGRKNKYFSSNSDEIRVPEEIINGFYIEVGLSGNLIRNFIIKLLQEYNFKVEEYKVYFRVDYSNI